MIGQGSVIPFSNLGKVRITEQIRAGGSANVYIGIDEHGDAFAIKIHRPSTYKNYVNIHAKNEASLKTLEHESIIQILDSCTMEEYGRIYPCTAMEYYPHSELFDYIQHKPISKHGFTQRHAVAVQIVQTIHFLHSRNLIFGDLNPRNILINPETNQIKFIDLETVSEMDVITKNKLWANKEYLAPEIAVHGSDAISFESEIWNLACILIEWMYPMLWKEYMDAGGWKAIIGQRKIAAVDDIEMFDSFLPEEAPEFDSILWPLLRKATMMKASERCTSHDFIMALEEGLN